MNKKKAILLASGIVVVAVAGILAYVFWPDQNKQASATPLNTAAVSKGNILVGVSGSGSVSAINTESIRTKEAGEVDEVQVVKGDVVKKGDVLITFVANDLEDDLKKANKSLTSLQSELLDKQENYKTLAMDNATDKELESAKTAIDKAISDIETQAESIASIQEDMLPPDPLTAPMDGTITAVNITDGEEAKSGDELFTMTDYVNLSVTVQVDELDIPSVKLDLPAAITLDALENQEFTGKVIDIAKEGTSSNGVSLFDVTVGLSQSEGVLVGMSAEVAITIEEKNDILTVPIEAVTEVGGKHFVNVPVAATESGDSADTASGEAPSGRAPSGSGETPNGQAPSGEAPNGQAPSGGARSGQAGGRGGTSASEGQKRVEVQVGIHDESNIEIVSGLSEGDKVVIPTVISTGTTSTDQTQAGGMGGFSGMSGGGMSGGSGGGPPSGGGGGGGGR